MLTSARTTIRNIDGIGLAILMLPPLFWAGNFIVGRAVRGEIPPMTLSLSRWIIALACLLPFAWRPMCRDATLYWTHKWKVLGVSLAGVAAFNALVYTGLKTTTATNGLLLNSFIPLLIVLFGALLYRGRLGVVQLAGMMLSFAGVVAIISQGQWERVVSLEFSTGDLTVFCAMICWAFYTLWLRALPAEIDRIGLLGVQIVIALVALFPFYLQEYWNGLRPTWGPQAYAALAYVGVFPSVVAYLLYNLGVARVGAARAGLFIHLIPVYGALLSVLVLGETFHLYHALGISAIFLGIAVSGKQQ